MEEVLLDFNTRVSEINGYFLFLEGLIREEIKLAVVGNEGEMQIRAVNSELAKTLKANSFLLLYNLIESSMTNAIEAIFDELESQKVSFNSVRLELKKIVLQNFKDRSHQSVYKQITDISLDIIKVGFKRDKVFSGNIDGDKITDTARQFGFSYDTDYAKTKHGKGLYDIKKKRNSLAHGHKSFAEVGRDTGISDLITSKDEVVEYIRQILQNIESYLNSKEYLDSSHLVVS